MHRDGLQSGFSLVELLVTMVILLIVSAAVFGLLGAAQVRYRNERQFLDSFQNARVGMDQMVAEIHSAGSPGANTYTNVPSSPSSCAAPCQPWTFAIPFRGYDVTTYAYDQNCTVDLGAGGTCDAPGKWDLSMEVDLDPYNTSCPNQVEIVEYKLMPDGNNATSTLMRSVTSKPGNPSPPASCLPQWTYNSTWTANTWVPFIENITNFYRSPQVPVFTYLTYGGTSQAPSDIHQIFINLWVRSQNPDIQTNQIRTIQLQAVAETLNPSQ